MHSLLMWIEAHPVLFAVVVWPAFTFVVTLAFRGAERWAKTHPRLASFLEFLEAAGLSAPGVVRWVTKALTSKGVAVPPAAEEFPKEEVPTNPASPKSKPPPNGFVTLRALVLCVTAFVFAYLVLACPHLPPPDGCGPQQTRCSPSGLPQVCSGTQRWTNVQEDPCPAGSMCCPTKSVFDANKIIHACVAKEKCAQ